MLSNRYWLTPSLPSSSPRAASFIYPSSHLISAAHHPFSLRLRPQTRPHRLAFAFAFAFVFVFFHSFQFLFSISLFTSAPASNPFSPRNPFPSSSSSSSSRSSSRAPHVLAASSPRFRFVCRVDSSSEPMSAARACRRERSGEDWWMGSWRGRGTDGDEDAIDEVERERW